jgi:small membrane protein
MLIQFLLIAAVALLLVFFLRNHGTSRASASVKIGFVLFLVFGVIAVLYPNAVTGLAQAVGVGRGTDLLLYALVVAFAFAMINMYLRFRAMQLREARLVRALALRDAQPPATPPES